MTIVVGLGESMNVIGDETVTATTMTAMTCTTATTGDFDDGDDYDDGDAIIIYDRPHRLLRRTALTIMMTAVNITMATLTITTTVMTMATAMLLTTMNRDDRDERHYDNSSYNYNDYDN